MNRKVRTAVHWIIAILLLFFAIAAFTSGGIVSGIIFMIMTVLAVPSDFIDDFWAQKVAHGKKWVKYLCYVVLFIIAVGVFPRSETPSSEQTEETTDATAAETEER